MNQSQPPAPREEPDPFAEFGTPETLAEVRREGREGEKARRRRQLHLLGLCVVKMLAIVAAIPLVQLVVVYATGTVLGDAPDLRASRVLLTLECLGYALPIGALFAAGVLYTQNEEIKAISDVVYMILGAFYVVLLKGVAIGTWLGSSGADEWHDGACVIASILAATVAAALAIWATRLMHTCEELDANRPPRRGRPGPPRRWGS